MKINIPLSCPNCSGKMYAVSYDVTLNVLKERSWQICRECNYEQSVDDFKKELLTI